MPLNQETKPKSPISPKLVDNIQKNVQINQNEQPATVSNGISGTIGQVKDTAFQCLSAKVNTSVQTPSEAMQQDAVDTKCHEAPIASKEEAPVLPVANKQLVHSKEKSPAPFPPTATNNKRSSFKAAVLITASALGSKSEPLLKATNEETQQKETALRTPEKKRPAPKPPTKEETAKVDTDSVIEKEKSPMTSRNIRRVDDKRRQPRTGWL